MSQFPEMPSVVEDFVRRYIDSVAELEALLLASSDPSTSWDAPHFAERLYISQRAAADVLGSLHRKDFLSRDGELFRYAPASDGLAAAVAALASAYPRFLIPITQMIHAKPHAALRTFADAFRLKEED